MTAVSASGPGAVGQRWRGSSMWPLVYLGMLAFQPAFDPRTGAFEWSVVAAVVAVFVPLYVAAEQDRGQARRWAPALTTAIGVLALAVNSGASVMFIFAAAFGCQYRPRPVAIRWLGGLSVLLLVLALVSPVPFPYRFAAFLPPLIFIWVIGMVTMDDADRSRESASLKVDNARIEHLATLSERERLSRDLHDLLGQSLTSIVVRAQLAQRLAATDPARGAAEMAEVERTARTALSEVRTTVQGWRHVSFDDELAVASDALDAVGVRLNADRDPDVRLTPSAETALALALREAVTNVVRHAGAHRCTVALRTRDGQVVLEVADDGIGGRAVEGSGLTGMRERIAALGGSVHRAARDGTSLTVAVPVQVAT